MEFLNAAFLPIILLGGYFLLTFYLLRIPNKDRD